MNDEALAKMVKLLGEYVLSVHHSDKHTRSQKIQVQGNAIALIEDVYVHTWSQDIECTLDNVLEDVTSISM